MKMQNNEANLSLILQLERVCGDLGAKLNLERRIRSVTNQNEDLSYLLGRLKNQIFEEKELNLRLRSEIANLKLQEIVDHKKIQTLLGLCNLDEPSVELFLQKDWPEFASSHFCGHETSYGLGMHEAEIEIQRIKIKSLKAELNERTELLLCERDSLIEEKMKLLKEVQSRKIDENQEINLLLDRLKHLQNMFIHNMSSVNKLNATSKSNPSSDLPFITKETVGSQTNLDILESQSNDRILPYHKSAFNDLKSQLKRSQDAQQRLQNRVVILQKEIDKLNKQKSTGSSSNQNLNERIQILAARNKDLERRRQLENEGFRSDVKMLRENIKDIEKQLLKVILSFGGNKDFNVDFSKMEAYEKSVKGADDLLVKLRDLQTKLS